MFKKVKKFMTDVLQLLIYIKNEITLLQDKIEFQRQEMKNLKSELKPEKIQRYYETAEYAKSLKYLDGMPEVLGKPVSILTINDTTFDVVASGTCVDFGISTNCKLSDKGVRVATCRFVRLANTSTGKVEAYMLRDDQCIRDDA